MSTTTRPKRPLPLIATAIAALPLAALVAPASSNARNQGVRA